MLYTLTVSPYQQSATWRDLLLLGQESDILVLMEDAVYGVLWANSDENSLKSQKMPIYVIKADLLARGVDFSSNAQIKVIDYADFVALTEAHSPQVKWA